MRGYTAEELMVSAEPGWSFRLVCDRADDGAVTGLRVRADLGDGFGAYVRGTHRACHLEWDVDPSYVRHALPWLPGRVTGGAAATMRPMGRPWSAPVNFYGLHPHATDAANCLPLVNPRLVADGLLSYRCGQEYAARCVRCVSARFVDTVYTILRSLGVVLTGSAGRVTA